jgi:hypothetical protein
MALLGVAAALLAGCTTAPGLDLSSAQTAVQRWAKAIEEASSDDYSQVLAPEYEYDGASAAGGGALPAPGLIGASGTTDVEVLELTESGETATARVRIQYTGFLSDVMGGGPGMPDAGDDGASWSGPGFGPPEPPTSESPGMPIDEPAGPPMLREVQGEQLEATPVSFTAIVILGLHDIGGSWMVVSQRQESSVLLVGNGAEAPIIKSLQANGSERPEVAPRSDIQVTATVEGATIDDLFGRIGYLQRQLTLDGTSVTGTVRAPRRPGLYVLEIYAQHVTPTGAYGIATRGIEAEVLDVPGEGFSFEVADGVAAGDADTEAVKGLLQALHSGSDPSGFFTPSYSYNGATAESAAWGLGLPYMGHGDSEISATVTAAEPISGGVALTVELDMEIDGFGYDMPMPIDEDVPMPMPTDPPMARELAGGADLMPEPFGPTDSEAIYLFEISAGDHLISAARPLVVVETHDDATPPAIENLTVNGSDTASVVGAETLTLAGSVSGADGRVLVFTGEDLKYANGPGEFAVQGRAPFTAGRWLVHVEASSYGPAGRTRTFRTLEIRVTEDAPSPTFDIVGGSVTPGQESTLNTWLLGVYLGKTSAMEAAYSGDYSFDGLTKSEVLQPRVQAYHADFATTEITAAEAIDGGTRVTARLEYEGTAPWLVDYRAIEEPWDDVAVDSRGSSSSADAPSYDAPPYYEPKAQVALDVVLELGDDDRIIAEWIEYGVSRYSDATELVLGPVTLDGDVGQLLTGDEVTVEAEVLRGFVDYATVRLGPRVRWADEPVASLRAPGREGRYVAEVVVESYPMAWPHDQDGDYDGDDMASPPHYGPSGVSVISARAVTVQ